MLRGKTGLSWGLGAMLVLGMAAAAAWAEPAAVPGMDKGKMERMEPSGHDGDGRMGQRLLADLNLSDEQIAKLKSDRLSARKQMIRDTAEIKTLHLDLFDETMNDKPDLDKVERLVKQIGELQTKMLYNRTKGMMLLRSILTPEQKRKFDETHMRMGNDGPGGAWGEPGDGHEKHRGNHTRGDDK